MTTKMLREAFGLNLRLLAVTTLCAMGGIWIASCASNPPKTPVASLAEYATKVEQSANVALHAAEAATTTLNPQTQRPLITRGQLDLVAVAVDKIGRYGLILHKSLQDYVALKAAGKDVATLRLAINQTIGDIVGTLTEIGQAVPNGVVQALDQAVTAIFGIITQLKAQVV